MGRPLASTEKSIASLPFGEVRGCAEAPSAHASTETIMKDFFIVLLKSIDGKRAVLPVGQLVLRECESADFFHLCYCAN